MPRLLNTCGVIFAAVCIAALGQSARAQDTAQKKAAAPAHAPAKHVILAPSDQKWGPAPPGLPPGAQMTVLDGDPGKAGVPFVLMAKLPDGYRVPPHWHPTVENVLVVSGTFMVGTGDAMNESSMQTLTAGGYAKMPARMHHYAGAKGETIIQVHGVGPFGINYVNPKDDPRKKTTP
jgi:hypothetical protein